MSYYVYPGYPGYYPRAQATPGPSGTYPGVCPPGYHWDGYKCVKGHGGGMGIGPPPADFVGQAVQQASSWHQLAEVASHERAHVPNWTGDYRVQIFGSNNQLLKETNWPSQNQALAYAAQLRALPWSTIGGWQRVVRCGALLYPNGPASCETIGAWVVVQGRVGPQWVLR